jgi:signal transduction histidine kinase
VRGELRDIEATGAVYWGTRRFAYGLDAISAVVVVGLTAVAALTFARQRRGMEKRIDELEVFASRVAHDVRSPLMPATLALERVRARMPDDDPLRPLVDRGVRSLRSIEGIVDALLTFASSGAEPAPGACASLGEALEAVVAELSDVAADKDVQLLLECTGPIEIACAPGVLVSIVSNLVGNAIKYMGGAIERRVRLRGSIVGQRARIEVIDTGPGLPAGAGERVFEPYVRMAEGGDGIGLGLATVRRLAHAHGGACGVEPGLRCGCLFWVELPLARRG